MRGTQRTTRGLAGALMVGLSGLLGGCSLEGLVKSDEIPRDLTDPAVTQTPAGALAAYHGTLALFRAAFGGGGPVPSFVLAGGRLTDELHYYRANDVFEARNFQENANDGLAVFENAQEVRGQAGQAIGLLTRYLPERPLLVGHLYAVQGYTEVLLAELFCSGIPLSTLDFGGDYTLRAGSTTAEVFTHAVALFDTALALVQDSAQLMHLAAIGKARALLGLGDYAAAAAAVAGVPNGYRYEIIYGGVNVSGPSAQNFSSDERDTDLIDREGGNGIDFARSGDPRTPMISKVYDLIVDDTIYRQGKIQSSAGSSSPIVLADGVEARLIQAEAALQANDPNWLLALNALRTDGTFDVDTQVVSIDNTVTPPDTTFAYDTLWHAGSGGYADLAPLADSGTLASRVNLLFRERAFWLYLTGHRQGDLRRLIRQYGRVPQEIYPVGFYTINGSGSTVVHTQYGTSVTVPVPVKEQQLNPQYTGCTSLDA